MGNVSITMRWKNDIVVAVDWAHNEWMNIRTCTSRWFTAIKQSHGACISGHMDMRIFLRTQPAWRVQTNHEGIINLSGSLVWRSLVEHLQTRRSTQAFVRSSLWEASGHYLSEPHLEVCRPSSRIKRPERGSQPAEWRDLCFESGWPPTIPLGDLNQYVDHHRRLGGKW